MLTVIFGAGASYDSAPVNASTNSKNDPWRPPLTSQLFDANRRWFDEGQLSIPTEMHPILERIRRGVRQTSLEQVLEQLKAEIEQYPSRWAQMVAVQEWIARVLSECTDLWLRPLRGVTTYVDLVSRLDDWGTKNNQHINYITFNYDTLLERAMQMISINKRQMASFSDYVGDKHSVFKPHGSVNWWYEFNFGSNRHSVTDFPLSDAEKASYQLYIGNKKEGIQTRDGVVRSSLPAIAIPVMSKSHSDFVFPPRHEVEFKKALDSTKNLLVVGWAGAEEHFLSELAERKNQQISALIVCGSESRGTTTVKNLCERGGISSAKDANKGFSDFLDSNALETWLAGLNY